ncbi:MAG: CRISPR-associated endonuclease Cas1 [Bacteroidetes bacterium]|nr:CRISPR-associated endonuclease Cas1 [Bacteroidota bacterium]
MQLFVNSYGAYVHVKEEMFEIKTKQEASKELKINHLTAQKVTSIIMSKGTALSTDAVALALKHNIDIIIVERDGQPIGRFWHSKLGSTTKIRKRQLEASLNNVGLHWTKKWLSQKLENQCDFLHDLKKHRSNLVPLITEKIDAILSLKSKIENCQANTVKQVEEQMRGFEGSAGRHYFGAIANVMPKEFAFDGRSFRPAKDAFNALLNYAYGVLYSKTERAVMLAGLDPYVGFMHRDDYNHLSLVYDFIEPYRIHAERFVTRLFTGKKLNKSHFTFTETGVSLNEIGKAFFVNPYLEYLDSEHIKYKGRHQTRLNAMQQDAHSFANSLIKDS